jgi:EAL domain-containing protein (putative c-di-GMP-specific phosphodiesterase class I)
VHSLIELARTFGLQIIAECIETQEEADHFRKENVEFMQGYFYGRPEIGVPKQ